MSQGLGNIQVFSDFVIVSRAGAIWIIVEWEVDAVQVSKHLDKEITFPMF